MAVSKITDNPSRHYCLSTDTKPTLTSQEAGSVLFEWNAGSSTLNVYEWSGNSWILKETANSEGYVAQNVRADIIYSAYGDYPQYLHLPFLGAAGTNDNDVVYTSGDISSYNYHVIECTAGTVDVQISVDGTNWNTTQVAVQLLDDVTTGGGIKSLTIASGKVGIISGKVKAMRILQNGATASNARGGHSNV